MIEEQQVNVLLVDDRPENLLAMESILEDLGHNLIRANSGREALRLLLEKEYALILLDVQMPGLDGFELAELIRERERTERTPIIFITAVSRHEEYVFKGYSLGAVDYLTKPFEPEILKSKVRFFTELFRQNQRVKEQARLLAEANAALDDSNVELEMRVRERTVELQTANQFLENEIKVRRAAEQERENALRREKSLREQAETASRMKDEFLATVSHELRTPLNSIMGWCQMLNEQQLNADEREKALETIFRNAKAQAQLIDDLLDTSRLITGNLHLDLTPTDVPAVVETVLNIVRPAAEKKKIVLQTDYEPNLNLLVCDAQRLQQMIWNLLTNAVKFTPPGGQIETAVAQNGDELRITVKDSGQGIAPEFLPFVFDRFRQQDSSITRKVGGLGLGLAIVRHLAELHGGAVGVDSAGAGAGAVFTITMPVSPIAAGISKDGLSADGNNSLSAELTLSDVRVLVVDDDADTREMMKFVLGHWGAQSQTSGSVAEALRALSEWQPDVILADLSMPGEDGYALLSKVRSHDLQEKAAIPMIALTAHAHPEESRKALSAGFQLHLSKPVDVQRLAEAIINLTAKKSSEFLS